MLTRRAPPPLLRIQTPQSSGAPVAGLPRPAVSSNVSNVSNVRAPLQSNAPAQAGVANREAALQIRAGWDAIGGSTGLVATAETLSGVPVSESSFLAETAHEVCQILHIDSDKFAWRPGQSDLVGAVFIGENVAAILPVGGGKNLIINACARAAKRLGMLRTVVLEISFTRHIIFEQRDLYGADTTFVTPTESDGEWTQSDQSVSFLKSETDAVGCDALGLSRCWGCSYTNRAFLDNPPSHPQASASDTDREAEHVVTNAITAGRTIIVTTPEFLVFESSRSRLARADVLDLIAENRILVVWIDEGQTLSQQRQLRAVPFAKFKLFVSLIGCLTTIHGADAGIVVTSGNLLHSIAAIVTRLQLCVRKRAFIIKW